MSVKDIKICYKRIGFSKEYIYYSMKRLKRKYLLLLANKLIEKVSVPRNTKKVMNHFFERETKKS